ncbi:MAG: imidazole glycerol phosphate synthase subunit HisH [Desulfarculus sp.]|nr:imidazole glycerol phosphate synthase subunit HisH [Desulfarculus sp.]
MLHLIDMGLGNLQSVINAFSRVGAEVRVTNDPAALEDAKTVILPGVGAFGDGMASLRRLGLVEPLRRHALERRRPLLGICLGMQLMAEEGDEGGAQPGLGLVAGRVEALRPRPGFRVPNIGWYQLEVRRPGALFADCSPSGSFYFVHSYHLVAKDPQAVSAVIDYGGQEVVAGIESGNLFGVQFHPEKSQDSGLDLLSAFVAHLQERDCAQ